MYKLQTAMLDVIYGVFGDGKWHTVGDVRAALEASGYPEEYPNQVYQFLYRNAKNGMFIRNETGGRNNPYRFSDEYLEEYRSQTEGDNVYSQNVDMFKDGLSKAEEYISRLSRIYSSMSPQDAYARVVRGDLPRLGRVVDLLEKLCFDTAED